MQLTEVQCLTADWSESDIKEIAAVKQSTIPISPSAKLCFDGADLDETTDWLEKKSAESLVAEFKMPRISPLIDEPTPPLVPRAEHLVIRDLDLARVGLVTEDTIPGRVVAHADWRFAPSFGTTLETPDGMNTADENTSFPAGMMTDLSLSLLGSVGHTLKGAFGGLPCFELRGISTLAPSHLRQGIAKRLTRWVFPYADRLSLPVILAASPMGLHLYRTCGFEEYRQYDITIDLAEWGGEGIHHHVIMVRWPDSIDRLPSAWQEWRRRHGSTS